MKTIHSTLSICLLLLLASCGGNTKATLTNVSTNQKVTTTVTGTRATSLDSWKVTISVKAYDFKEGKLEFEIYAGDLSDKNVKFDWKDDRSCLISITERDGQTRNFQLITDSNQLQLAEV